MEKLLKFSLILFMSFFTQAFCAERPTRRARTESPLGGSTHLFPPLAEQRSLPDPHHLRPTCSSFNRTPSVPETLWDVLPATRAQQYSGEVETAISETSVDCDSKASQRSSQRAPLQLQYSQGLTKEKLESLQQYLTLKEARIVIPSLEGELISDWTVGQLCALIDNLNRQNSFLCALKQEEPVLKIVRTDRDNTQVPILRKYVRFSTTLNRLVCAELELFSPEQTTERSRKRKLSPEGKIVCARPCQAQSDDYKEIEVMCLRQTDEARH